MARRANLSLMIVAALGVLALCGSAWAVEGMVSYWKFDGGSGAIAYDWVGGIDGTIYGAQWPTGQVGSALSFNGKGDGVYIEGSSGTSSPLNIYDSDITISSWVKIRTGGTVVARAKPHYITYRLMAHPHTTGLNVYAYGRHYLVCSYEGLSQGIWYHIAGVFDRHSDKGYVYINGTLAASGPLPDAPAGNDGLTKIGCRNNVNESPFSGTIDEVAIFNRALSSEEIQQHYQNGLSGRGYPVDFRIMAIRKIESAISEKREALERIDAALEKEWAAYKALEEMLTGSEYGYLSYNGVAAVKQRIHSVIQNQEQSKEVLRNSIAKLEDVLAALGFEVEPTLDR